MSDTVELLPCPFCGGKALKGETVTDGAVWCSKCRLKIICNHGRVTDDGLADAITAWNTRAPSPDAALLAAEMQRRAVEAMKRRAYDLFQSADDADEEGHDTSADMDRQTASDLEAMAVSLAALPLPTSALAANMQLPEVARLMEAAQETWDQACANHDKPPPVKYTAPYGGLVKLKAALDALAALEDGQ